MISFAAWMREVDEEVQATAGLSVYDLADQPYREWYDEGADPEDVALTVLEEEGWL